MSSLANNSEERKPPPRASKSILKVNHAAVADNTTEDIGKSKSNGESDDKNDRPSRSSWKEKMNFRGKKDGGEDDVEVEEQKGKSRKGKMGFRKKDKDDRNADDDDDDDEKSKSNKGEDTASVLEADAMSTATHSIQTNTTQANKHSKVIEDCETEFHDAIRDHDWDYLEGLLKDYDPTLYKKEKRIKRRQFKVMKYVPDIVRIQRARKPLETPVSPLMALDHEGRTPLFLGCVEPTPAKILIRLMNTERDATAIKDKQGLLPLHMAIQNRRPVSLVERLVRGYYQASWMGDDQNRTALSMAIDVVAKRQREVDIQPTKTYWGFPATPEDVKWQEQQEKIWSTASFLAQNRFDRRKRLLTVEHSQIILAINRFGPPTLVAHLLATGKKHLIKKEVAGHVFLLLVSRQYPKYLFNWILEVISIPYLREQQDPTGCGAVAAHFRVGCIKHKDQSSDSEMDTFAMTMKRLGDAKKNGEDFAPTPQYTEWWEKLFLFINLWVAEDVNNQLNLNRDLMLLHNALINPDIPPLLIHLLAKINPESVLICHPISTALPIHVACRYWQFRDFPPRKGEKRISQDQVCSVFLEIDPTQTRKRHRNRLPLHHAIAVAQPWEFIKPLVTHDPESLVFRDPVTMLRPFQMAAVKIQETFDIENLTRRAYSPKVWDKMADDQKERQMTKVLNYYDLKQLDLIYELLRHSPALVRRMKSAKEILWFSKKQIKSVASQPAHVKLVAAIEQKMARSLFGLGNVEGHFIGWCYEIDSKNVWNTHRRNFAMVKEAIIDGFIPVGMDKWWAKLKFWLWQDCPWDHIPRRADFLLHCALCNPKVSPWIIELILECFPRSATLPLPDSDGCYPLHIACITDTYIPLYFEFPNKRSVIEIVSKSFNEAVLMKWKERLPLHYAILGSKQWKEMRFMAEDEPVSLAIPESESDFFPFQLMALHKSYSASEMERFQNIARVGLMKKFGETNTLSLEEKFDENAEQLNQVLLRQENETIGCIFELLRRNPMLVHVGLIDNIKQRSSVSSGNNFSDEDSSIQLKSSFGTTQFS
uniref:Uncharacterized protein n=1 Tax=Pseudo-nitzschia australis TaxID=44445 RepID=A0A7S4AG18_9STRA|mmetsp:Transcript_4952/g.11000  ORF Transcript_4952/g.11000 Transcript_4952/m.11000 type:complete len:1046 (-) Transcript_4952:87-3224(-)